MIDLGPLDRLGYLYSRDEQVKASGAVSYVETAMGELYLTKVVIPTNTVLVADKDSDQVDAIFKSRWFQELRNGMILVVEGQRYRITRHDELGRRHGWQIYGRAIT